MAVEDDLRCAAGERKESERAGESLYGQRDAASGTLVRAICGRTGEVG